MAENDPLTPGPKAGQGKHLSTPSFNFFRFLDIAAEGGTAKFDLTLNPPTTRYIDLISSTGATVGLTNSSKGIVDTLQLFGDSANGVEILFHGTAAANKTAGFDLFAFKRGPKFMYGRLVYTTDTGLLLGTRVCDLDPLDGSAETNGLWADTLFGTDKWGDTSENPGVIIPNDTNDDIVSLNFDLRGHTILHIRSHNVDGSGSEMTLMGAIITAY